MEFRSKVSLECLNNPLTLGLSLEIIDLLGAIHTGELDRSEIDLSPKRSECERSNANREIDPRSI